MKLLSKVVLLKYLTANLHLATTKFCNFKLLKVIEQHESKKRMLPNQSTPFSGIFESKLHLNNKQ